MSWQPCDDPKPGDAASCDAIEHIIVPRVRDLGGFEVRRALPAAAKQMVGPFIFFDQMGPAEFLIGSGIDVRPHPHIGLATVTYLFEGELMHRDSLGTELAIKPGELNLMSAGRGIVHSERSSAEARTHESRVYGIQAWAALPKSHEEDQPAFAHYDAPSLPRIAGEGKTVRLIMGSLYGARSPAVFPHPCFYAEAVLAPGAVLPLDADYDERAVYIVSGEIDVAGQSFGSGRLLVFRPGDRISILATSMARLMLVGGEPMDGPRHIWWNFVSSSKDRIDAAKADWKARRFSPVPTDVQEFIPLPE
ncbi:pirin family protein [Hyphomicrobium sp.]|uniref:pirin family protein n=1 Tax=Hyphomicrobium sp. TaxID=82 RepID=UPI002E31CDEB|nr:pirin family protein [Hyphomicrobium sp.]HEX2842964.1 pirin family protein [Hyphomicrobium sp.]